jgi:hypothetical protein
MKLLFSLAKNFWRCAQSRSQSGFRGDLRGVQLFEIYPCLVPARPGWDMVIRVGIEAYTMTVLFTKFIIQLARSSQKFFYFSTDSLYNCILRFDYNCSASLMQNDGQSHYHALSEL